VELLAERDVKMFFWFIFCYSTQFQFKTKRQSTVLFSEIEFRVLSFFFRETSKTVLNMRNRLSYCSYRCPIPIGMTSREKPTRFYTF